jgi:hypothetical protein
MRIFQCPSTISCVIELTVRFVNVIQVTIWFL